MSSARAAEPETRGRLLCQLRGAMGVIVAAVAMTAGPAVAGVIGSLANFDVVNDTGKPAYGFEIRVEDPTFDKTKLISIFGYNRDFGLPGGPGAVVRFGLPTITDLPGVGVSVKFGGTVGGVFTPSGPYNTPGESCWPLGAGWSTAAPCDHYGISTLGQPAATTYNWLVETTPGSGVLAPQPVGVPPVTFAYTPPPPPPPGQPPAPAAVVAQIHAVAPNPEQPENVNLWGEAYWLKTLTTKVDHNIDLGNLLRGDPHQEMAEVEMEWEIFQNAPAGMAGANEMKERELQLGDADKAVMRRYEFYKYLGPVNLEDGEAICNKECEKDPLGLGLVGDFVGAQMAGFNVEADVPVPEPATLVLLGTGLAGLVATTWRRARRK